MSHEYWTYIVSSLSGTLYIGMTNNIERRMWEHKSGNFEGFACDCHCNRLVYFEAFAQVLDAIAREKQLKGWRRSKKIALIESRNPRWEDLAEKWDGKSRFLESQLRDGERWRGAASRGGNALTRHGCCAQTRGPSTAFGCASLRSG